MSKSLVLRLKKELRATADLMELVDVLKRVAASQFQSLDRKRQSMDWTTAKMPSEGERPTSEQTSQQSEWATAIAHSEAQGPPLSLRVVLEDFFRLIPPQQRRHPFLEKPSPPLGMVIVTSDEGFLGGLNATVIQKALSARDGQQAELIVLGERGRIYLEDLNEPFTCFRGVGEHITGPAVERLRDYIVEQYLRRKFARVLVFYPRSRSFTQQEVASLQLLPYERPSQSAEVASSDPREVILEPSAYLIIEYLIKLWLTRKIHEVFWQSKLSELAARAMHLEASFLELAQQKKKQTLQYFRSLHEVTDTSIRESYAGMLARKKEAAGRHA
ncbi:MAG: F0F1 ATP synthase subunit gamma [Nitrospiria bacterium]